MPDTPANDSIFEFERDFAGSLRCIPMAVRLKLDQCGVKLSLRQWARFTVEDRRLLLQQPCDATHADAYRTQLTALIRTRAGEEPQNLAIETHPAWEDSNAVPAQVLEFAAAAGVAAPSGAQWQHLSPLQRFTLLKLSRASHDNVNFVPAMREFGLS